MMRERGSAEVIAQKREKPFGDESISKTVLANGLTVLVDVQPQFRSAGLAVSLLSGSRDEPEEQNGITHCLEHLVFKATANRDVRQIAALIDEFGGEVNAFTDAESFCVHGVVPGRDLCALLDFSAELLRQSTLRAEELAVEKEIIRQEILEADDDPADAAYQRLRELFWPDDALGRPVFGTLESLSTYTPEMLRARREEMLSGKRIVITAAGAVNREEIVGRAEALFGDLPAGERPQFGCSAASKGFGTVKRPVNQTHLLLARSWPSLSEKDYLAGLLIANLLGHGNSSRLFQVMREERGICYDVDASVDAYADTSMFVVSAVCERKNVEQAMEILGQELGSLASGDLPEEEFQRARRMLRAQLEMETDSLRARLWRAVETEIAFARYVSTSEVTAELDALCREDLVQFCGQHLAGDQYVTVFGGDTRGLRKGGSCSRLNVVKK